MKFLKEGNNFLDLDNKILRIGQIKIIHITLIVLDS